MTIYYSCICENGDAGSYWSGLSASEKLRYGEPGSERVFASLMSAFTARGVATTKVDTEILEPCDAFVDNLNSLIDITWANVPSFNFIITTNKNYLTPEIAPDRTAGFHGGQFNGGYVVNYTTGWTFIFRLNRDRVAIDGINIQQIGVSDGMTGIAMSGGLNTISNNIMSIESLNGYGCIRLGSYASYIFNNILCNSKNGIYIGTYTGKSTRVYNNLAYNCVNGFLGTDQSSSGSYQNNIAIGCDQNWALPPDLPDNEGMNNNMGVTGDSVWDDSSSALTNLVSTDFTDYASLDFTPASASSHQVDAGINVFGKPNDWDMLGKKRPSPRTSASEITDIGPFEYDWGEAPDVTVQLKIENIIEGSVATLEKTDGTVIISPEIVGSDGIVLEDYVYTVDTDVVLKVRKSSSMPRYKPFKSLGKITSNGLNIYVSQVADEVLN